MSRMTSISPNNMTAALLGRPAPRVSRVCARFGDEFLLEISFRFCSRSCAEGAYLAEGSPAGRLNTKRSIAAVVCVQSFYCVQCWQFGGKRERKIWFFGGSLFSCCKSSSKLEPTTISTPYSLTHTRRAYPPHDQSCWCLLGLERSGPIVSKVGQAAGIN